MTNTLYQQAFYFSDDDLSRNRAGALSAGQVAKLSTHRKARQFTLMTYFLLAGATMIASIGTMLFPNLLPATESLRRMAPLGLGIVTLVFLGSAANYFVRSQALILGKVSHITGPTKLLSREIRAYGMPLIKTWFLKVYGVELLLENETQKNEIEAGSGQVTVHYMQAYPTNVILSIEPMQFQGPEFAIEDSTFTSHKPPLE